MSTELNSVAGASLQLKWPRWERAVQCGITVEDFISREGKEDSALYWKHRAWLKCVADHPSVDRAELFRAITLLFDNLAVQNLTAFKPVKLDAWLLSNFSCRVGEGSSELRRIVNKQLIPNVL